jgi:hypothetical protein
VPGIPTASASILAKLLIFFLKAGALTFGSGLVIGPFLQQGVAREHGWLSERDFLVAIAVGMISPGPIVITATFVGYLVAGFEGSVVATIGIFLPSFILVLLVTPISWRITAPTGTCRALSRAPMLCGAMPQGQHRSLRSEGEEWGYRSAHSLSAAINTVPADRGFYLVARSGIERPTRSISAR